VKTFSSPQEALKILLATLRSAHWVHWTGHWQVRSNSFYGDHLLLERVYTGITAEIDTLAEKMIAMFDINVVDPQEQISLAKAVVDMQSQKTQDPIKRSLDVEQNLQLLFESVFEYLESQKRLPLGLNDFIAAAANNHDTFVYLLTQRVRQN
jgi:DNA-binding ferritin-like protein